MRLRAIATSWFSASDPPLFQVDHFLRRRIDELLLSGQLFHARGRKQLRFLQLERRLFGRQPLPFLSQRLDLVASQQAVRARHQHADQQHHCRYYRADQLPARPASRGSASRTTPALSILFTKK